MSAAGVVSDRAYALHGLKVPLTDALTVKTRRRLRRSLVAGPIDIISEPSSDAASFLKPTIP
jgi:hypothetical protein